MPKDMSQDNVADVVIVTALEKERDAVLRYLDSPEKVSSKNRTVHKAYLQHENSETGYQVVVLCLGAMGNVQSAIAVTQAIDIWNPAAIVLTGIMGGVEHSERSLGDLIVAEQIVSYESGKVKDTGTETRFQVQLPTYKMIEKARHFPDEKWVRDRRTIPRPDGQSGRGIPQVHFEVVASGEKVIADTITVPKLQSYWNKLAGVEMEGFGTALAVYQADSAPAMLMVKGICDWANPNKNNEWQVYAADVAAAYVVNFLKSKPIECLGKSRVQPKVIPTKVVSNLSGPVKFQLCQRLGDSWSDLADYLEIPEYHRRRFTKGRECQDVLEWLRERDRLHTLTGALEFINRPDLINILEG
ncbi:phosphorylase family protein [Microcoleus sp. D3_18a_C4]|uniref:phosphorylase family protein n=1 Tax=Microcoleus sp. D3_18a_C4 TaxID=3055332 RepID=UPI002FD47998